MDDWVVKNERKTKILTVVLAVIGILIMFLRVPIKLASLTHTFFWMFVCLFCLIMAGLYAESLKRISELPRIEYLKRRGIR